MFSLFFRNFYLYKHNKSELVIQSILNILQILPLYFMLLFFYKEEKIINTEPVLFLYLIALFIINVAVEVNFYYNIDISHNKATEITLSGTSRIHYTAAQTFFSILINILVCLIPSVLLLSLSNIHFRLYNISLTKLLIIFALLVLNMIDINIILMYIVKKSKVFSYSSLITITILIISGAYNSIEKFPLMVRYVSYLSPYTYFFLYIKHCFFNNVLPFGNFLFFVVYLLITVGYHFVIKIAMPKQFD